MNTDPEVLNMPIASLPLSNELIQFLSSKNYKNLQQVLKQKISYLRIKEGLSFSEELELFNLVQQYGLEKLWREE